MNPHTEALEELVGPALEATTTEWGIRYAGLPGKWVNIALVTTGVAFQVVLDHDPTEGGTVFISYDAAAEDRPSPTSPRTSSRSSPDQAGESPAPSTFGLHNLRAECRQEFPN